MREAADEQDDRFIGWCRRGAQKWAKLYGSSVRAATLGLGGPDDLGFLIGW